MTESDYTAIARQIYRDLKAGAGSIADWRACDRYNLAASELRQVIAASAGHLRIRQPGIIEIVQPGK